MRELRQGPDPEPQTSGFNRHWTSGSDSSGCFFRRGVAFNGKRFDRTAITAPAFSYLREIQNVNEGLVAQIFTSWNQMSSWMKGLENLRKSA